MAGEIEILGGESFDILGEDPMDDYLVVGDDGESLADLEALMGDDYGDDDLMGALPPSIRRANALLRRRTAAVKKRARKQVRQAAFRKAALARKKEPTRSRELILGFDSVANVAAAATADITSRPQVVFRPDRVVVPATIAPNFLIVDIRVGKNSQFTAAQPVPGEVFSQGGFQVGMKMDTAQISQDVVMRVTNTSAGPLRFNAAMIGPALE